ncbi:hypothetical protein [Streptomyces sp. H27-H5]|uniref:hypothetical protein n=1 Tax=Streptomyces sp. H27-H5 TaxID=2996460 RepID=UPI002270919B|nr:hypothetical protein [Streptomyces sp. H27-H5]MCY0963367.1 hypothetical protein [Streptomyces sp. H27-H5]
MYQDDQAAEGPRLQDAAEPTRARRKRSWRQDAVAELEDLEELYGDLPAVRL